MSDCPSRDAVTPDYEYRPYFKTDANDVVYFLGVIITSKAPPNEVNIPISDSKFGTHSEIQDGAKDPQFKIGG
jgi:hypothetical protein